MSAATPASIKVLSAKENLSAPTPSALQEARAFNAQTTESGGVDMRPKCPRCAGPVNLESDSWQPRERVRCLLCGWMVERDRKTSPGEHVMVLDFTNHRDLFSTLTEQQVKPDNVIVLLEMVMSGKYIMKGKGQP